MSNHFAYVSPNVLDQLRHLRIPDSFDTSKLKFVAGGGYSDVFKAEHHFPGRPTSCIIAIKQLRFYMKEDIIMLFEKDVSVWSNLQHTNITPLLGFTFEIRTGYPLLISEWMENGSAWEYINKTPSYDAFKLVCDVAKGLSYLHDKEIVHSDIKTDNVLISSSGTAMICDFGITSVIISSKSFQTFTSSNKGTARYLSYELVALSDRYPSSTKASDVWAFGMTVYELLTRKRAYGEKSEYATLMAIAKPETPLIPTFDQLIHQVANKDIFQNLIQICLSCWECEPKKRINMTEVLVDLGILCKPSKSENISTLDSSPVDLKQRIEVIAKNVKSLVSTGLYSSILEIVFNRDDEAWQIFRGVFSLIFFSKSPLSDQDIDAILGLEPDTTPNLLSYLQPLVKHEKGNPAEIRDASLRDYLVSCKGYPWYIDTEVQKLYIATKCFERMKELLKYNICDLQSDYILNTDVPDIDYRMTQCIPSFLKYICCNWAHHLRDVSYSYELCSLLRFFVYNQLLFWFEILSLTSTFVDHVGPGLLFATEWVGNNDSELSSFLRDAYREAITYLEPISKSVIQIYTSLLPLTKEDSPMSMHYAKYTPTGYRVEYIGKKRRNDCIKTIQVEKWGFKREREWEQETLPINLLLFSPDGTRVLSDPVRVVCVWEATSGKLIAGPLTGERESNALSATYSLDGRYIIVASDDCILRKWDAHTNRLVWEREIDRRQISFSRMKAVVFSSDAKSIIFGNSEGTILVLNVETGKQNGESLEGHTSSVSCLSFSSDGHYFASGSEDRTVIIWDMDRREAKTGPLKRHTERVTTVNFSPSGNNVISGSLDGTILVWDAFTGEVSREIRCRTGVYSITYSPNGLFILACGQGWMNMWNAADVTVRPKVFEVGYEIIWRVSFAPDSSRFVSVSSPNTFFVPVDDNIQIWDASLGVEETKTTFEEQGIIRSISLSPSVKFIASASREAEDKCSIYLWDVQSGELVKKLKLGGNINSVSFSPINEIIIAFGSSDGAVQMWDVTNEEPFTIGNHKQQVDSVAFSLPDGNHVASGSCDNTTCIWNVESRKLALGPLIGHKGGVRAVAYSPDGTRLASGSSDKTVRIWNSETGQLLSTLNGHSGWAKSVAYSFDGSRIVSGSNDNTIRVWNAESGEIIGEPITGHDNWVKSVCFSPDGKRILSGSDDNTARIWDTDTGKPLFPPFRGHTGWDNSVCFFPDGTHFATGSWDGTIKIWTLDEIPNEINWELRDDGWVVGENGELMMWIPRDLRDRVCGHRNISILKSSFYVKLDFGTERNTS